MREKTARIVQEWTDACDAEISIAVLGGAWKPSILSLLGEHEVLRFGELGRLPKRGDQISADGYEIRVESVRENRIEAVRIHESSEPRPAPPSVP